MTTTFHVTMDVEDLEGKNVLVFLLPTPLQPDYRIHPWRRLTASAGATEWFEYKDLVSVKVVARGERQTQISSNPMVLEPGELARAMTIKGPSPMLSIAPPALARARLGFDQMGVVNHTHPFSQLDIQWLVGESPVVTCPRIDQNMTCAFQYSSQFYFMVTTPPVPGRTFPVQSFSNMWRFVLPRPASSIHVRLTRPAGCWHFGFETYE